MDIRKHLLSMDADFVGMAPKFLHIRTSVASPEIFISSFFTGNADTAHSYHVYFRGIEYIDELFRVVGVWGRVVEISNGHISKHGVITEFADMSLGFISAIIDLHEPEESLHNVCLCWLQEKPGFGARYNEVRDCVYNSFG